MPTGSSDSNRELYLLIAAALVAISIKDLRPNTQDTSAFYLQNIYLLLSDPNKSNVTIPPPPAFSPPKYAVWINTLWFLSLAISITAFWPHCCNNGRVDTSRPPNRGIVPTSEHEFAHSLPKAPTSYTFPGQLRRYPHSCTFPFSLLSWPHILI